MLPASRRSSGPGVRFPLLWRGIAALVLCGLLATCGSAAHSGVAASAARGPAGIPQSAVAVGSAAATTAAAAMAPGAPAAAGQRNQAASLPALPSGQMLVRTATIELEGADPATLAASVQQIAAASSAGADAGYVADTHEQWNGSALTATLTITVPAPAFASVMEQLRHLGKVMSEASNSQDVTEQYVDVDAQLQALRATQAQLLQLLAKTQQLSDTILVQNKLTEVDAQINQLEGRENYLKQHSAFSTITVSIHPPVTTLVKPPAVWSPLATLLSAAAALGVVGQGVVSVLIWLLVFGLPLAAFALIVLLLVRLGRRVVRERRTAGAA